MGTYFKNGDTLNLNNHVITRGDSKPGADIYVDGNRIGEIGGAVIKDRKIMASDGILVVIINVDMKKRELLIKITIRNCTYMTRQGALSNGFTK